jgi:hypothetical protein
MSLDPGPGASPIVGEGQRHDAHAPTLAKEPDGILSSRHEPTFEFTDRGVHLPRNRSGIASPPRLLYIVEQE